LVAIALQRSNVDHAAGDGPEAPSAGGVLQVASLRIDRAGENALPGQINQPLAIRWAKAIAGPGDEGLDSADIRARHSVELRDLDDPDALGFHGGVLAAKVGQAVSEPGLSQDAQRAGFADTLRPFQDQRAVSLCARGLDSGYGRNQPAGTDGAGIGRVSYTEIGVQPGVNPRNAVPGQGFKILANRMKRMISGDNLDRLSGYRGRNHDPLTLQPISDETVITIRPLPVFLNGAVEGPWWRLSGDGGGGEFIV